MKAIDQKIFATLFFSLFVTVTGVGIVVPLLPVYAHSLGASGIYIGLIFGAFSLSRTLFLPYFGRLSDKYGRKRYITLGLAAYTVVSVAFVLAANIEILIAIRLIQGIASAMIMPVIQAYVGDITPAGKEGFSMGIFHLSVFVGLSIGPLLGGVINDRFSLNTAFFCMGFLALTGFVLSSVFLPPTRTESVTRLNREPVGWSRIIRNREIGALFLIRFAYTACIGIIWGFLPVYADAEFALSSSSIGVLVMLGVSISGAIHVPMGYLADRINRRAMVITGGLTVSGSMLCFYSAGGFWGLFYANVLFGLGGGVAMPALMALGVIQGNRTEAMGSVMALLTMGHSFGMLVGSLLAGLMMDAVDLLWAFLLGAVLMAVSTAVFTAFCRPLPKTG